MLEYIVIRKRHDIKTLQIHFNAGTVVIRTVIIVSAGYG